MKILLTAVGSSADIQPFVILAKALVQAGHSVKVCSYNIFKKKFDRINVPFAAVGPPINEQDVHKVREDLTRFNPIRQLDYLVNRVFLNGGEQAYHDYLAASQGYHFAVCHSLDFIGQHAMIANNIPWASVVLCPGVIPTVHDGPLQFPNLGGPANRLAWRIFLSVMTPFRRRIERFLENLDGRPRNIRVSGTFSNRLNLVAGSAYIGALYPDAGDNFEITGAWIQPPEPYQAPEEVRRFLEKGKPQVVFAFRSLRGVAGQQVTDAVMHAIRLTGVRAIVHCRRERPAGAVDGDNLLWLNYRIPYRFLFRQAPLIVHRAGSLTTVSACEAGAASLTLPLLADQRYWAKMLYRLGVAPKPLAGKTLNAARLARALQAALKDERLRENAARLSTLVTAEEGPRNAVKAIENCVYRKQ